MVSRSRYGRPVFAALVLLALAGIYLVAGRGQHAAAVRQHAQRAAQSDRAPVTSAVRVCPAVGSGAPTAAGVAVTALPAATSAGSAVITRLTPGGSPTSGAVVATHTRPAVLQISNPPVAAPLTQAQQAGQPGSSPGVITRAARGGVEVQATGAMAQGLDVEQTGPGGLVTAQCSAPGTSFWFLGPGQAPAGTIQLYLANTGSVAADAQVSVVTDGTKGPPLLGNADNGITVPPHGVVVQSLSQLLQSSKVVALNVTTSVGQVVAAVRESSSPGADGNWLPATGAPAQHLVIPGMPGAPGPRSLYIAVPGTAAAQVKITAVTAKGSYQPTGGTGIDLLGGSALSIPLPSLGGVPGAISISATAPVVATMLAPGGPAATPGALAAPAGPVLEQGVVADNPAGSAGRTELVLSAPRHAASVRITTATPTLAASGQSGRVVQIGAGKSVVVPVVPPGGKAGAFSVIVTPLSGGPVYAGRVITSGGTVRSILAVRSSPTWIALPGVTESLSAFLH
ncbi:MAG TPA: DUF5719 family protein [Streptosporangiaceae bacterium]|nr:DUF5719 family protein [Streptosporangiaceae bacterium]